MNLRDAKTLTVVVYGGVKMRRPVIEYDDADPSVGIFTSGWALVPPAGVPDTAGWFVSDDGSVWENENEIGVCPAVKRESERELYDTPWIEP